MEPGQAQPDRADIDVKLVVGVLALLAIAGGAYFFFFVQEGGEQARDDAAERTEDADLNTRVSGATRNPAEELPETNPFDTDTNPFTGYRNPFD